MIYREEICVYDNIEPQLKNLYASKYPNSDNWQMNPNYLILMQTASVIGNHFDISTLMAVMPINLTQNEVKM